MVVHIDAALGGSPTQPCSPHLARALYIVNAHDGDVHAPYSQSHVPLAPHTLAKADPSNSAKKLSPVWS